MDGKSNTRRKEAWAGEGVGSFALGTPGDRVHGDPRFHPEHLQLG